MKRVVNQVVLTVEGLLIVAGVICMIMEEPSDAFNWKVFILGFSVLLGVALIDSGRRAIFGDYEMEELEEDDREKLFR